MLSDDNCPATVIFCHTVKYIKTKLYPFPNIASILIKGLILKGSDEAKILMCQHFMKTSLVVIGQTEETTAS